MTDNRNGEAVRQAFDAVLEGRPSERNEILDRICGGNDALRREVLRMLDVYARSDAVLAPYEQHVRGSRILHTKAAARICTPDPLVGRQIDQYQILDMIGGGGMGVAYRARDTKLDRLVALKFLPIALTRDPEARERFVQEARAASMLDHPNVAVVYEIGEVPGGRHYIAMAHYAGEPLKRLIARGPLSLEEALDFGIQIANGLAAAHERGIVHRDVKPANVIVTRKAEIKLVDFGLAKMVDVSLTRTGATLGTVAYMSPEQARSEDVDQRSDLWSLGVVLFEMLTGRRPFKGTNEQAVVLAILTEEPPFVSDLRADVPAEVDEVVRRLLRKNPDERYLNADELIIALERIRGGHRTVTKRRRRRALRPTWRWRSVGLSLVGGALLALGILVRTSVNDGVQNNVRPAPRVASIAVLPTANHSGDPEQEYLADGIHDALISELARIDALRVISRTSTLRYRDSAMSIPEIAHELDVHAVVEASLFRADDSVRIQVQLIRALPVEHHLWSRTYDTPSRTSPF